MPPEEELVLAKALRRSRRPCPAPAHYRAASVLQTVAEQPRRTTFYQTTGTCSDQTSRICRSSVSVGQTCIVWASITAGPDGNIRNGNPFSCNTTSLAWATSIKMQMKTSVCAGLLTNILIPCITHRTQARRHCCKAKPPPFLAGVMFNQATVYLAARPYQSSLATIREVTGSFIAPRRRASRAISSATPSISNMIRPGWTLQAQ